MTNSFLVTVYTLSLGDYDSVTGIPARQYTPTSAKVVIRPKGSGALVINGAGYYPKTDALGLTQSDIDEGDVIMDNYNSQSAKYWLVVGRQPQTWGNTFVFFTLDLQRLERPNFHILSSNLQGFETIDDGHKFEDGFERLYVTS